MQSYEKNSNKQSDRKKKLVFYRYLSFIRGRFVDFLRFGKRKINTKNSDNSLVDNRLVFALEKCKNVFSAGWKLFFASCSDSFSSLKACFGSSRSPLLMA